MGIGGKGKARRGISTRSRDRGNGKVPEAEGHWFLVVSGEGMGEVGKRVGGWVVRVRW